MRTLPLLICSVFVPIFAWAGAKPEPTPKQYRRPMTVALGKRVKIDIIANFDFSKFKTSSTHELFDISYSNALSTSMFGKSATIYLGEKLKPSAPANPNSSRYMYITQLKEPITIDEDARKYLAKKPGFKNQQIDFRTNRNGLKLAIANYTRETGENYHHLVVMGPVSLYFSEANMLDPESIAFE